MRASSADEQDDVLQTIVRQRLARRHRRALRQLDDHDLLDEMARTLRGSDVVLHAVDIQGVRVQNDENGSRINSNDALHLLSRPTGGEVFKNSNDVNADLEKMLRAQERRLRPRLPRAGLERRQVPRAESARDRRAGRARLSPRRLLRLGRARARSNARSRTPRSSSTTSRRATSTSPRWRPRSRRRTAARRCRSSSTSAPPGLLRDAKANDVVAEVYRLRVRRPGRRARPLVPAAHHRQRARLAGHDGIKYFPTLTPSAGQYALKTLVRVAGTERKGFARTDVDVPRANDVACCRRCSSTIPRNGSSSAARRTTTAPYPFHINGEPFMPSASAQVSNGHSRRVALFVFNVEPDELTWDASATDAPGSHRRRAVVVNGCMGQDVMKLVFDYAPADLQAGPASFDVTVHKKGSSDARKSSVPLVVQ